MQLDRLQWNALRLFAYWTQDTEIGYHKTLYSDMCMLNLRGKRSTGGKRRASGYRKGNAKKIPVMVTQTFSTFTFNICYTKNK